MNKKVLIDKPFQNWTRRDLDRFLGVKRQKHFQRLKDWFDIKVELTTEETEFLEALREDAEEVIDLWNETELRENFILELTKKVNFKDRAKLITPCKKLLRVSSEKETMLLSKKNNISYK